MRYEREVKYTEGFSVEEGNEFVLISSESRKFFMKKVDFESFKAKEDFFDTILRFKNPFKAFFLFNEEFHRERLNGTLFNGAFESYKVFPANWIDLESDLIYVDHSSHLLFDKDGLLVPRAYIQSYVGGITNRIFRLDKVKEILDNHKKDGFILSYWDKKIPYYNADKDNTDAVEFIWILPREKYNEIYSELIKSGEKYPSCRLEECWLKAFNLECATRNYKKNK